MFRRVAIHSLFLFFITSGLAQACTTAIISGKYTPDGRPLLYKHRDTSKLQNKMMYFKDGRFEYMGLVNTDDTAGDQLWAGCNSTGFAIMNSATYNQNLSDSTEIKDREGFVMKRALQICATLSDFEAFLDTLARPMGLDANFGVIDAQGGAAYYETNNHRWVKFDVNDAATAPFGYLIRTNYANTGEREEEYGLIRYETVAPRFYRASLSGAFTPQFLFSDISRCLAHSLTGTDLGEHLPADGEKPQFVFLRDYVTRHSSASAVVVQGVKSGESPAWTTLWTVLGFPFSAVAVPTWMGGGDRLPSVLTADDSGTAPLCRWAMQLKEQRLFPMRRGSGSTYLNRAALLNRAGTGILQQLKPLEASIFEESAKRVIQWREQGLASKAVKLWYDKLDNRIARYYHDHFQSVVR